ncbi:ribosome-inactivating family protein [Streptomyces sp. NPDC060011]|uniref:ribosome-inactivating family protein n=1 Tax=Streptomyces sp. NPDC060011 TaxID=3347037 RepID=UPI0036AA19A6
MLVVLITAAAALFAGTGAAKADTPGGRIAHVYMNLRSVDNAGTGTYPQSQYLGLLTSFQNAAGHYWRNGVGVTQTQGDGATLIRMDLNLSPTESLRLWFTPRNMYLVGFTNHNNDTYAFNDYDLRDTMNNLSRSTDAGLLPPSGQIHSLSFGGNYASLSNAAGYGRDAMNISFNDLWNSAWQLQYGGNTASTARSLLFMIQYTSEAARFFDVYGVMSAIMANANTHYAGLPAIQQELETHWEQLSRYADDLWAGRNPAPSYVGPHAGTVSNNSQLTSRLWFAIGNPSQVPPSTDWHTEL